MDGPPSITDGVHRKGNFLEIIPVFSTFKKIIIKAILCNFSMRLLKIFNFFFAPENMKNHPKKLLIIGPDPFFSVLARLPYRQKAPNAGLGI